MLDFCARGHSTKMPGSRTKNRTCRGCERMRDKQRDTDPGRQYQKYLNDLNRRMTLKRARIDELERFLNVQENGTRNGESQNY